MIGAIAGVLIGIPLSQAMGMSDGFAMMFIMGVAFVVSVVVSRLG